MLNRITPVILTFNEAPNICRTLDRLGWAADIVIVDSFSTDGTLECVKKYPQVRLIQRIFDNHASQWNFAIKESGIKTDWVLALDADYVLTDDFINELDMLKLTSEIEAYRTSFCYCVWGKRLSGTLYPPVTVLYRWKDANYIQDGHTQRLNIEGEIVNFKAVILHDDRKNLSSWLQSQDKYMRLEAELLSNAKWNELGLSDKLRKLVIAAPIITFFYCLLVKRGFLDGRAGLYYAMQRSLAEGILSLRLIELSFNRVKK